MALIEPKFDFTSLTLQLTRIADALDRAIPPIILPEREGKAKKRGPESVIRYGDDKVAMARNYFTQEVRPLGLPHESEDEIIASALAAYRDSDEFTHED